MNACIACALLFRDSETNLCGSFCKQLPIKSQQFVMNHCFKTTFLVRKGWFSQRISTSIRISMNQPESKWELPRHKHKHKHKKNEHVPFFLCLCYAYFALVSSENGDEISASISTRRSWYCACVCLYACAYALVKTSLKGTLSRAALQKLKSAKTHFTATKAYKYWSSFDTINANYNTSVMKLKKSSIIVIPSGAQDPNLKKSTWFFQVLPPWQCPFKHPLWIKRVIYNANGVAGIPLYDCSTKTLGRPLWILFCLFLVQISGQSWFLAGNIHSTAANMQRWNNKFFFLPLQF